MNFKAIGAIAGTVLVAAYNIWVEIQNTEHNKKAKEHNREVISNLEDEVTKIIQGSNDERVKNEGKDLLIKGTKSWYSDRDMWEKYKRFIIKNGI